VVDDVQGNLDAANSYRRRIADDELDELIAGLPAIALEGPKAVGKTATALQRAATIHRLDDEAERSIAQADTSRLLEGEPPVLIDEWQRLPESFDRIRRAVDDGARAGSFLLTGSASPTEPPTHSGAGRIVQVRLRPMTLAERDIGTPTVSLRKLLQGEGGPVTGVTDVNLERYVHEILASGFPGLRGLADRLARAQLDGYIDRIIDRDFEELGRQVRRPGTLRRWMQAYAAATATTTSYEKIRDAATSGHGEKPARATTQPYRDVLERLWILDPVPAWLPTRSRRPALQSLAKGHCSERSSSRWSRLASASTPKPLRRVRSTCARGAATARSTSSSSADSAPWRSRSSSARLPKSETCVISSGSATSSARTWQTRSSSQPDRPPTDGPTVSPSYPQHCSGRNDATGYTLDGTLAGE
jgi:predicted AAA+ superfamily ATPase